MEKKEGFGFMKLAQKTLAVITTSLSTLLIEHSDTIAAPVQVDATIENIRNENPQNTQSKPQFLLTLNQNNSNNLAMGALHGSHRSHSSHSSHSSHYSSSPSSSYTPYTPSKTVDTVEKVSSQSSIHSSTGQPNTSTTTMESALPHHKLGSRTLRQESEGTDVQQLQQELIGLGYTTSSNGYFGPTTELAVMKFQVANNLHADGVVDSLTLNKLQSQRK